MNEQTGLPPKGSPSPWHRQQQLRKGSGRTTRMMREAWRLASEGRAVYIICDSDAQATQLRDYTRKSGWLFPGVSVEGPGLLVNFDWFRMRLPGSHSNCVVLLDHAVIERRFMALLDMLHKFDTE